MRDVSHKAYYWNRVSGLIAQENPIIWSYSMPRAKKLQAKRSTA